MVGYGVRIAKEATVRWSAAAVSRVRSRKEVIEGTRFVVLLQLVSVDSEELWRRMERRFQAAASNQNQG